MKRLAAAVALLLGLAAPAWAQQPVVTNPSYVTTVHADGTIAVTNTFQQVFAAATPGAIPPTPRLACLIQNIGTSTMYIYIGNIANATLTNSFQLIPPATNVQGGSFDCTTATGAVIQDAINIAGTANDNFAAVRQ